MPVVSAGILLFRLHEGAVEVFIAHMGGPFWAKKDDGGWSVPKGEYDPEAEKALDAALREFQEEIGSPPPDGEYQDLGVFRQPSGKLVAVYASEAVFNPSEIVSNTFEMEWPRGSGRTQTFPEIDRAEWLRVSTARRKLVKGQLPVLDALMNWLQSHNIQVTEGSDAEPKDIAQASLF